MVGNSWYVSLLFSSLSNAYLGYAGFTRPNTAMKPRPKRTRRRPGASPAHGLCLVGTNLPHDAVCLANGKLYMIMKF